MCGASVRWDSNYGFNTEIMSAESNGAIRRGLGGCKYPWTFTTSAIKCLQSQFHEPTCIKVPYIRAILISRLSQSLRRPEYVTRQRTTPSS